MADRRSAHQALLDWLASNWREGEKPPAIKSSSLSNALGLPISGPEVLQGMAWGTPAGPILHALGQLPGPSTRAPGGIGGFTGGLDIADALDRTPGREAQPDWAGSVSPLKDLLASATQAEPTATAPVPSPGPPTPPTPTAARQSASVLQGQPPESSTAGDIADWRDRWEKAMDKAEGLNVPKDIGKMETVLRILGGMAAGMSRVGRDPLYPDANLGAQLAGAGAGATRAYTRVATEERESEEQVKQRAQELALTRMQGEKGLIALQQAEERLEFSKWKSTNEIRLAELKLLQDNERLGMEAVTQSLRQNYLQLQIADAAEDVRKKIFPILSRSEETNGRERSMDMVPAALKPAQAYAWSIWYDGVDPDTKNDVVNWVLQGETKDKEGNTVDIIDQETGMAVKDILDMAYKGNDTEKVEAIIKRVALGALKESSGKMPVSELRNFLNKAYTPGEVYELMKTKGATGGTGSW